MMSLRYFIVDTWKGLLNIIAPRTCLVCGNTLIRGEEEICRLCLDNLNSTMFESFRHNPMEERMEGRIKLISAFAGFHFRKDETLRTLIHQFKYHGNKRIAVELGRELGRKALYSHFIDAYDYIIPVPLHKKKERIRGYNQSLLLAQGMSEVTKKEVRTDVLLRDVFATTQTQKNHIDRYLNVKGNFCLGPGANDMTSKHLLLIDDVFTTGATSEACLTPLTQIPDVGLGICTVGYVS